MYGCETWALRKEDRRRIEALEMWVWRRMCKISWQDRITNEDVLIQVGETRSLLRTIELRKKHWFGHILRHPGLLRDAIEGRMLGKRGRGRKRIMILDDVKGGRRLEKRKEKRRIE